MNKQLRSTWILSGYPTILMVEYTISFLIFQIPMIKAVVINQTLTIDEINSLANKMMYE